MAVVNRNETNTDLGEVAEAGIHLPEATADHSENHPDGQDHDHHDDHEHGFELLEVLRVVFVALAAAAVWFHLWEPFHRVSVIGLVATLIGGYPIFKEAFENIVERRMTMELSMTIALVSALAIGEFFTALVITAFVLAAEILEGLTVGRGRRAIQDMLNFLPQTASVLRGDQIVEVNTKTILPGEIVVIRPGGRIPVDGTVINGHSFVEQAAITGEPMPSEKSSGSNVYAGTINQAGTLQVRAERLGKETTFGKIIEAVENAERSRAPIQKTADRLAGYLVYFALGAALLTFLITHNLRSTISVIIVAGACGIAAGTPLAILGAIGRAARKGSIIKGGIYLEALGQLHTVFFDKTGTLTYGLPSVTEIYPAAGVSKEQLIEAAASAERNSEHPLGGAIVRYAEQRKLRVSEQESFEYRVGRGVLAMVDGESVVVGKRGLLEDLETPLPEKHYKVGGTEVFVARGGSYLGSILIADEIRPSARSAVKALEKMNIRVVLLTGDSAEVAELFEMAHARTHADIKAALAPMDLYPANLILAGRDGTLLYIRPGRLPKRPDGVDVTLPLDGATSRTAWTGFVSLSEAVQVENPPQDYVSNDNVSPDRMYATPILDPQKYSAYYAFDPGQTNTRQLRMIELLENAHGVSDEAAIQITMDEKVLAPTSGEACSKRSSFPGPGLRTRILTSRRSLPPWRVSTVCSRKSRVGPSTTWLFARRYARRPTRLPGRSKALPKPGGRSRRRNSGVWRTPSWRRTPLFVRGLALSISSLETFTVSDELPTPFPSAVPRSIHRRTKESSTRSAPGSWSPAGLKRCGPWRFDRTSKTRALLDAYCCQRVPFVVTFHPDGSLTSYSEMLPGVSEDPSSPHFGDQMRLASQVELRPDYFYLLDLERNTESRIDIVVTGASSPMAKTK